MNRRALSVLGSLVSCCVPFCTNYIWNSPNLSFYRMPKDRNLQKKYVVLMRSNNLKLQSDNTQIGFHLEK